MDTKYKVTTPNFETEGEIIVKFVNDTDEEETEEDIKYTSRKINQTPIYEPKF